MPESKPNWKKIKAEYIQGESSYRGLAKKYGVSFSTLRQIAAREKWTDLKEQTKHKVDTRITESIVKKQTKKAVTVNSIADMLLAKLAEDVAKDGFICDPQTYRQVSACLKDLKDIKGLKSAADAKEQMARIKKLEADAERLKAPTEESRGVIVEMSPSLEEYSE